MCVRDCIYQTNRSHVLLKNERRAVLDVFNSLGPVTISMTEFSQRINEQMTNIHDEFLRSVSTFENHVAA